MLVMSMLSVMYFFDYLNEVLLRLVADVLLSRSDVMLVTSMMSVMYFSEYLNEVLLWLVSDVLLSLICCLWSAIGVQCVANDARNTSDDNNVPDACIVLTIC